MENRTHDDVHFDSIPSEILCEIIVFAVDFRPIIRLVCTLWNRMILESVDKLHLPLGLYPFIPHSIVAPQINAFTVVVSSPWLVPTSACPLSTATTSCESPNVWHTDLGLIPWVWSQLQRGMTNTTEERGLCTELATRWLLRASRYGNLAAMIWCKSRSRVDLSESHLDVMHAKNRALAVAAESNQCEAMKLCRLWGATNLHQALESAAARGRLEALKLCHLWLASIDIDKDERVAQLPPLERRAVYCLHQAHVSNACFNAAKRASDHGFQAIAVLCNEWKEGIRNDLTSAKHTFDGPTVRRLRRCVPWCSRLSYCK
jgi:hypothetical protein